MEEVQITKSVLSDHLCNLYGPTLVTEVGQTHAIAKTVDEDVLSGETDVPPPPPHVRRRHLVTTIGNSDSPPPPLPPRARSIPFQRSNSLLARMTSFRLSQHGRQQPTQLKWVTHFNRDIKFESN